MFFRASDFDTAFTIIKALAGIENEEPRSVKFPQGQALLWICLCAVVAFFTPTTRRLREFALRMMAMRGGSDPAMLMILCGSIATAVVFLVLIAESAAGRSPFIYFNF